MVLFDNENVVNLHDSANGWILSESCVPNDGLVRYGQVCFAFINEGASHAIIPKIVTIQCCVFISKFVLFS